MDVIAKIKKWYRGKLVVHKNDPNSSVFIVSGGHFNQPPLAKFINFVLSFWVKHWHILLPIIVAALVALFIHFDSKESRTINSNKNSIKTSAIYYNQFSAPLTNRSCGTASLRCAAPQLRRYAQ